VLEYLYGTLAVIGGTAIQAATGFGLALIAVPVLSIILTPTSAVLIGLILPIPVNLITLAQDGMPASQTDIKYILIATCLSLPGGIYLLHLVPINSLQIVIGLLAIGLTYGAVRKTRLVIKRSVFSDCMVGLVSGIASGTTGMGGPLLALILAGRGIGARELRTTMSWYLITVNSVAIALLFVFGRDFVVAIAQMIVYLPTAFVGLWFGGRLLNWLSESHLQLFAVCLAGGAGVVSVICGLRG
jgi:uncharacterized protein